MLFTRRVTCPLPASRYFNGTVDALVKIGRTEGLGSLWSGLSPTLALAVPTTVIYLSTYEAMRKDFAKRFDNG